MELPQLMILLLCIRSIGGLEIGKVLKSGAGLTMSDDWWIERGLKRPVNVLLRM